MKLGLYHSLAILLLLLGAGCKSNWKASDGADLVIYFEGLSDNEKRQIVAIASRHSDKARPMSTSESMVSKKFTIRMWLTDANEFRDSGKSEIMKKAMEEIRKPEVFEFSK